MNDNFISPAPIYARVKEELKSYFNTGAIDDLLFETWTKDCIDKFENTYLPIQPAVMDLCNFKCELPCDFKCIREVYITATYNKGPITSPHVFYYQTDCRITPTPAGTCTACVPGYQCMTPVQQEVSTLPNLCGVPDEFIVTHKVMAQMFFTFQVTGMLKPGNYKTLGKVHQDSLSRNCQSRDTFDIVGNQLMTSFRDGTIYMLYYADPLMTEDGFYEIPNNDPFQKYLYHYLRYMMYVQLVDQSTEENYNLLKQKRNDEKGDMNDSYINAKNYAVSGDIYSIQQNIIRSYTRNNMFKIR